MSAKFRQPPYSVAEANIISKSITTNGTYNASSDNADGYNPVTVNVSESVIVSKSITANGTYNASSDNANGYNPVTVNVPGPVLGTKSISANGTYPASSDGYDGFSSVTVSVSGGAQATITVSYDSSFYNKTMTCSDGITTYTETTTNAGSTVFSVNASGTWTVSCNGVTKTVEVVLDYSTQMAITNTITVYGAASDTISFTDVTGAKTVTTDTSGQGSVSITFIPPSSSIIFTSSVAKNPNNLSQAYGKTVTISTSTSEVYVMPNGALYWWGYNGGVESVTTANGWSHSVSLIGCTFNTNNISLTSTGSTALSACGSSNVRSASKIYCVEQGSNTSGNAVLMFAMGKNVGSATQDTTPLSNTLSKITLTASNVSNGYIEAQAIRSATATISAIWYE